MEPVVSRNSNVVIAIVSYISAVLPNSECRVLSRICSRIESLYPLQLQIGSNVLREPISKMLMVPGSHCIASLAGI